jgi:competence protein ComEC
VREPLLLPCAALAAGILAAHFFFFRLSDVALPAALSFLLVAVTLRVPSASRMRTAAVCCCLWVAGIATQVVHRQGRAPRLSADDAETVLLSGCVTNPPVFSPNREQFTLDLGRNAQARLSVSLKGDQKLALSYGQRVEAAAKVRLPRNFQNPDSFDYAAYLAAQHIYWTATVSSPADVRVVSGRCGSRLVAALYVVRTWALARIADLYPNDQATAALLQATLIGETSGVERRWTNDFRITGTYHALVISGQHVSVLAFTILTILQIFRFRRIQALFVAAVASWVYAFISGLSSPVVRAAGGFTLFVIASYCYRKTRILNMLAAVGLVYLAFDPDELFDPSFQLSFLSAAAIAVFAIPLMERLTEPLRAATKRFDQNAYDAQVATRAAQWRTELRLVAETLSVWTRLSTGASLWLVSAGVWLVAFAADAVIVSACVQFGLALPMVSYFHRLSITGLSANIAVIPLLSLVVPFGFAAIATGWHILAIVTRFFLQLAQAVAGWHVHFEPAWRIAALPAWLAVLFSLSLVLLAICIRHARYVAPALALSLTTFAVLCWQPWPPKIAARMLEVSAIDVSQGDSLLIVFPDGETMLVDAGGYPGMERMQRKPQIDMGEDVVSPYLWSRRIRRVDYAVLTHGHSDHMAGLAAVLDNFRPRTLWIGAEPETDAWRSIRAHAAADHVAILALNRDSAPVRIGGACIRILAPSPDYLPSPAPANNDSLVFEITYGHRSILMTGDAERAVEETMLEAGQIRPVTLLKVGHHGSRTSSSKAFLDELQPRFAFISDGYLNQFHHPHPDVLERLAEHHTQIFRTDQRGLLTFRTDGEHVEVSAYR